jgi:hypothetical protein
VIAQAYDFIIVTLSHQSRTVNGHVNSIDNEYNNTIIITAADYPEDRHRVPPLRQARAQLQAPAATSTPQTPINSLRWRVTSATSAACDTVCRSESATCACVATLLPLLAATAAAVGIAS